MNHEGGNTPGSEYRAIELDAIGHAFENNSEAKAGSYITTTHLATIITGTPKAEAKYQARP
ncbi:unnamed protein product [Clonostachys solani]|uniref:Uncharacterized protein n=1 Tax=Clonostachys solani TaxID=160281 RepID=A0A9N9W5Y1_9HYPO|nr:unnamed protein product [Clonostachys solani]